MSAVLQPGREGSIVPAPNGPEPSPAPPSLPDPSALPAQAVAGIELVRPLPGQEPLLTPAALALLADLHRRFEPARQQRLAARRQRQAAFDAGALPDFRSDTAGLRAGDWKVAPLPQALLDRRVEITGPTDPKMVINALNSGASCYMADFEDSTAPTWDNLVEGQRALRDAVAGTLTFTAARGSSHTPASSSPRKRGSMDVNALDGQTVVCRKPRLRENDDPKSRAGAKHYTLRPYAEQAVLLVRPRGWHLDEKHVRVDGEAISASLFDLGLFALHNAQALAAKDRGPYFYLPKLQSMEEATLWDEVLTHLESALGLPRGQMKVTVLIETLPAAFEMDEILHALRGRIAGLNCGRWDYIFSCIKTLRAHRGKVLPERGQVTMTQPFLKAYADLLVQTCHRRGAHAMGGMAAQVPIAGDPAANDAALQRVREDKLREVRAGHDGTWVAHPALIPLAREIFDAHMPGQHQQAVTREDVQVAQADLLRTPRGSITRAGFDNNVEVCVRYLAAWLDGNGCVPIHGLMEDAATAEIARAQLWQWLHYADQAPQAAAASDGDREPLRLDDGTQIDFVLLERALLGLPGKFGGGSRIPGIDQVPAAIALLERLTRSATLEDFLTIPAYALID